MAKFLHSQTCILPKVPAPESERIEEATVPSIDIFINPAKKKEMGEVVKRKQDIAKNYFRTANMRTLYPHLFEILWESTLPCFGESDSLLVSCELAGTNINCTDLFSRVPTDKGMCCALNAEDPLKDSEYKKLVEQMQGQSETLKVRSAAGQESGLSLTLDLHSNTVSFGTHDQRHSAFSVFVGAPQEFPMMREHGIQLEPGREHFIDLSADLVTTNNLRDIEPSARDCFFTDEGDLDFYESYTFSNCRLECGIKKAEDKYNCIPWHLPQVPESRISKFFIHPNFPGSQLHCLRPLDCKEIHQVLERVV